MTAVQTYVIAAVSPKEREWDGKNGKNVSNYVKFEGDERTIEVTRRADKSAPEVGQQLTGEITTREHQGNTYYGFKKQQQGGNYRGGGKDYSADPVKLAAEAMRAAHNTAIDYARLARETNAEAGPVTSDEIGVYADFFYGRVKQAMEAAR